MGRNALEGIWRVTFGCIAIVSVAHAVADPGRDFSAFYSAGPAQPAAGGVHLTLSLSLANHTGSAIAEAVVRVLACGAAQREAGASGATELAAEAPTALSISLFLSADEHEAWQQGCGPTIEVSYTDGEAHR